MLEPTQLFWTVAAFAFVFGSLIGSFLNVVIYRVPEGLSIISPGSRCPSCETPIRWYDNIPIVSWLVLGGQCRHCGARFSVRYALVEALTGALAVAAWYHAGVLLLKVSELPPDGVLLAIAGSFFLRFTFLALLVAITFIDLDHYIIPHGLSLPGIALGVASPWISMALWGQIDYLRHWPPVTPTISLVGAIGGFLAVVAIFYFYLAWRGIEGIGGGDATLMAMIGAWMGWPALFFVFFAASVQGLVVAGIGMLLGNRFVRDSGTLFAEEEDEPEEHLGELDSDGLESDEVVETGKLAVPFGPFIALAAVEFYLFGPWLPRELNMLTLYL